MARGDSNTGVSHLNRWSAASDFGPEGDPSSGGRTHDCVVQQYYKDALETGFVPVDGRPEHASRCNPNRSLGFSWGNLQV